MRAARSCTAVLSTGQGGHVVRPRGRDGVVTTDGPFVESKEQIGGFYIINAADLDEGRSHGRGR